MLLGAVICSVAYFIVALLFTPKMMFTIVYENFWRSTGTSVNAASAKIQGTSIDDEPCVQCYNCCCGGIQSLIS